MSENGVLGFGQRVVGGWGGGELGLVSKGGEG